MRYVTLAGFVGFFLKIMRLISGRHVASLESLKSRRSVFMKGSWSSDALNSTCTIMPLGLSGSIKISKGRLGHVY